MTRQIGILGYPLAHSISPAFQQAALDHLGLDVRYSLWETEPSKLPEAVDRLRRPEVVGANVTIPHKDPVISLLDEVDAPLDDANVSRFNELLREIAKISQFIVITHNKRTMSRADRLYGITMEEPGMSKVVSVDLEASEEQAA